jgi:hypothetical protein
MVWLVAKQVEKFSLIAAHYMEAIKAGNHFELMASRITFTVTSSTSHQRNDIRMSLIGRCQEILKHDRIERSVDIATMHGVLKQTRLH